jgi:hypothetical protein
MLYDEGDHIARENRKSKIRLFCTFPLQHVLWNIHLGKFETLKKYGRCLAGKQLSIIPLASKRLLSVLSFVVDKVKTANKFRYTQGRDITKMCKILASVTIKRACTIHELS